MRRGTTIVVTVAALISAVVTWLLLHRQTQSPATPQNNPTVEVADVVGRSEDSTPVSLNESLQTVFAKLDVARKAGDGGQYATLMKELMALYEIAGKADRIKILRRAVFVSLYWGHRTDAEGFLLKLKTLCASNSEDDRRIRGYVDQQLADIEPTMDRYLTWRMEPIIRRLMGEKKYQEALNASQDMLAKAYTPPIREKARWFIVEAAYALKMFDLARDQLTELKRTTEDEEALGRIDLWTARCMQPQEAIDYLQSEIRTTSDPIRSGDLYWVLGDKLFRMGRRQKAIDAYRLFLNTFGDKAEKSVPIKLKLGTLLLKEDPDACLKLCDEVRKQTYRYDKLHGSSLLYAARALIRKNEPAKAAKRLTALLSLRANSPDGRFAFSELKRLAKAHDDIVISPDVSDYYELVSDRRSSTGSVLKFAEKHPDSPLVEAAFGQKMAQLISRRKEDDAIVLGNAFLELEKKNGTDYVGPVNYQLGHALYEKGEYEKAMEYLQTYRLQFGNRGPDSDRSGIYLAHCYLKTKQLEKATVLFEKLTDSTDSVVANVARRRLAALTKKGTGNDLR